MSEIVVYDRDELKEIREKYNPQQRDKLNKVARITRQLIKIEDLKKRKYQSQYGLKEYFDASDADLELDSCPPYSRLEEQLREAIISAEKRDLQKDPLIIETRKIAFS